MDIFVLLKYGQISKTAILVGPNSILQQLRNNRIHFLAILHLYLIKIGI